MNKEELLYKYFLNALSAQETEQFATLLKEDKAFEEQFEFEKGIQKVVTAEKSTILKQQLQEFEKEIQQSPTKQKWFHRKSYRIAASVAIIIAVGLGVYISNFNTDKEELYASYYTTYPNTVYTITRGNHQNNEDLRKAFEAYEANDHTKAIPLFISLREKDPPEYIDFYLAQSYLNDRQLDNAISIFKDIIANTISFSEESQWYLALAYLKNKDNANAKAQLKKIAIKEGGYKQQEAVALLEKLN